MIDFVMYFLILCGAGWLPLINIIYKPSGFLDVLRVVPLLYAGIITMIIFSILFFLITTWIWAIIVVGYAIWTALIIAFGKL